MFKYYPKILYKIDDFDYLKITDVAFYAKIRDFVLSFGLTNGRVYTVKSGESPALLSYKIYGTSRFDYSILLLNDIRNIYDEWPKDDNSFKEYIIQKYGSLNYAKENTAFYYRGDRQKVSQQSWNELSDPNKYAESYYEYEARLNDEKARIKLLDYELMVTFEVELRRLINNLIDQETNRA